MLSLRVLYYQVGNLIYGLTLYYQVGNLIYVSRTTLSSRKKGSLVRNSTREKVIVVLNHLDFRLKILGIRFS